MTKRTNSYRHKLMRDNGADLVAYGVWRTVSVWMIPQQVL